MFFFFCLLGHSSFVGLTLYIFSSTQAPVPRITPICSEHRPGGRHKGTPFVKHWFHNLPPTPSLGCLPVLVPCAFALFFPGFVLTERRPWPQARGLSLFDTEPPFSLLIHPVLFFSPRSFLGDSASETCQFRAEGPHPLPLTHFLKRSVSPRRSETTFSCPFFSEPGAGPRLESPRPLGETLLTPLHRASEHSPVCGTIPPHFFALFRWPNTVDDLLGVLAASFLLLGRDSRSPRRYGGLFYRGTFSSPL